MIRELVAVAVLVSWLDLVGTAAYAQQPTSPRHIGVVLALFSQDSKEVQAFRQGLRDAGYVEGRDVVVEWRSSGGDYALVPGLVVDLVQRKVDVIVVDTTVATRAAKRETSTIPIVMATIADPVGTGLVASLAHPGGNVTGLSVMTTDLSAKRLEILKEAIPRLTRVAVLRNPDTPYHSRAVEEIKAVAPPLSIQLSFAAARTSADFSALISCPCRVFFGRDSCHSATRAEQNLRPRTGKKTPWLSGGKAKGLAAEPL